MNRAVPRVDIAIVVPPRTLLLDVAGPAEAFRLADTHLADQGRPERFRLRFVGPQVQAASSVGLQVAGLEPLPDRFAAPTWLMVVGQPAAALGRPDAATLATVDWLRRDIGPLLQSGEDHRLVGVCTGTLLLARAGLLGGRRCTTHHAFIETLRRLAPEAQVVDNRVFVLDGALATSAGVTAGIDLALHLIALACGDALAARVAKDLVVYLRRTQNDPELSPLLAHRHHIHPALHRAQDAVCERPGDDWTLGTLAEAAHVTTRHLLRLFAEHAAVSPMTYVEKIRLERARQALSGGASVTRAAEHAGFASDLQLRRAWGRHFEGTPRAARP